MTRQSRATLTNEEDGERDEEEEDMWHHVERVEEAAVVQDAAVHVVGRRVVLVPAECQGHGRTGTLPGQTASEKEEEERQRREESKQTLSEQIQHLEERRRRRRHPQRKSWPDACPFC